MVKYRNKDQGFNSETIRHDGKKQIPSLVSIIETVFKQTADFFGKRRQLWVSNKIQDFSKTNFLNAS